MRNRTTVGWIIGLLAILVGLVAPPSASAQDAEIDLPRVVLPGVEFEVAVRLSDDTVGTVVLEVEGREIPLVPEDDGIRLAAVEVEAPGPVEVVLRTDGIERSRATTRAIPGWLSVVPPVLAIVMALVFKQVIPALFLGVWVGAWAVIGFTPAALFMGMLEAFQVYVLDALANPDHGAIILFSFMIGGMVGIVTKNGGMQGVVNYIVRWATTARRGQTTTGLLGVAIFFDDYANTLVVGNTMRKVTDSLRISREKLAYIVDSTAAPVSCVALVTTWIGYEVGLIGTAVEQLPGLEMSAYSIFLRSIPYSFYPFLTMFFVFTVANMERDFGPMHAAEQRARRTGAVLGPDASVDEAASGGEELQHKEDRPQRAINAVLPILVLIVGVLLGLYVTGEGETLQQIIGDADSYRALLWASLAGAMTAALLSIAQGILTLEEVVDAWYTGLKSMLYAMIILVLAWSLSSVSGVLQTADYLVSVLGESLVPGTVPALVFVLSAATAFATGSSWGTMGIILPLVVPLAWAVLVGNGMDDPGHFHILYSTVACVLGGAVLGDHCSPISDTTILSSMASGCDHIEHVRTQLPYAVTVGAVATLLGTLPAGFGMPWWIGMGAGALLLAATIRWFGKPVSDPVGESS